MKARALVTFGALAAIAISIVSACSSVANPQCDCIDPTLSITVPPESASAVKEVQLSGGACTGVKATCVQNGIGGCASWRFEAIAAGTCHIDVFFQNGTTFAHDLTIAQTTGCCAGFYADPESAAAIDVIPPGGEPANDAGVSGDSANTGDSSASSDAAEDAVSDSGSSG